MTDGNVVALGLELMPTWTGDRLRREFEVVELNGLADRPPALLADPGRFRGLATRGDVGADAALIDLLPNLEIIACFSVGYDGVDLARCRERGIVVTNTPDVLTHCVADLGMGLVLAVLRRIVEGDRYVRAGRWLREGVMDLGAAPRGKTLGIVGLGRIGLELAARAEAFGMNIAYYNRNQRADVDYAYHGDPASLAAACDVLALTCPGGAETHHLVDADVLAALGGAGVLVNIARGSVVDEAALVAALQSGTIAGAGLDVFEAEPQVPEALFAMDNVVLQPHQASATVQTRTAMGDLTIDNLLAHFAGKPPLTPVA